MQPALPGTTVLHLMQIAEGRVCRSRWWAAAKGFQRLQGNIGESAKSVLGRWVSLHGRPQSVLRHKGTYRASEAAMTLVSIEEPAEA